jgi:Predicted hydrolases or acyltransferases (alpha/beta hydrolase superfamily)
MHRQIMTNPMTEPHQLRTPDGRSLDLYVAGPDDGETLLFYPGSPSSGLLSRGLVAAAAECGMRTVSWSRPGYGSSTRLPGRKVVDVVPDTVTVLDHLGAERCHAIGWSGGGSHVLAAAALLPERVRSVATIGSTAPYPAEGLDWTAGMGKENVEEFAYTLAGADALLPRMEDARAPWVAVTADEVAAAFGDLVDDVDRASITGEFSESLAANFREALREGYWGWYDEDLAIVEPWGFDLASIRVPVHVWQGRHDRMVPYSHGEWLASHIPTACPHLSDAHGHLSLVVDSMPEILDELIGAN